MLTRLQADLKTAMLARDAVRTQVLRMALAAYKNEAVAKGLSPQGILAEADALAVLKRLVKSREDSIAQFEKVGQADRAAQERAEIELLLPYLPAMIEGPALEAAVKAAIASGLARISICSSRSAIFFCGTMKETTTPFRVIAVVFPFRHKAGNCACPCVTVNVSFISNSI